MAWHRNSMVYHAAVGCQPKALVRQVPAPSCHTSIAPHPCPSRNHSLCASTSLCARSPAPQAWVPRCPSAPWPAPPGWPPPGPPAARCAAAPAAQSCPLAGQQDRRWGHLPGWLTWPDLRLPGAPLAAAPPEAAPTVAAAATAAAATAAGRSLRDGCKRVTSLPWHC